MTLEKDGISYEKPIVTLLQDTGIGVAEYAARTCYDSFNNSENTLIKEVNYQLDSYIGQDHYDESYKDDLNNIEDSELLSDLAWAYHHHSILEHSNLSFLIKGTSRGVLQEHARHRIQAISVRSTRYTMSGIINAFVASKFHIGSELQFFTEKLMNMDMFVTTDEMYQKIEIAGIFDKLNFQYNNCNEFYEMAVAKSSMKFLEANDNPYNAYDIFEKLQKGKKKRNVGDAFKHIVSDNWKVDMVVTFNIRSLKNYFTLRDSGAAYFQIKWLAEEMKKATPIKYLKLIDKKYRDVDVKGIDND